MPSEPRNNTQNVLDIFEEFISKYRPKKIKRKNEIVEFSGGFFRLVSNWNLLNSISRGTFHFDQSNGVITYSLSLLPAHIFNSIFALFFFVCVLSSGEYTWLLIGSPIFGFFLLLNYFIAIVRFQWLVDDVISKALLIKTK